MTKPPKRVTLEEINAARTPRGGWTRKQLEAWGLEWPVKSGWVKRLTGDEDARVSMPGRTKQAIDLARKTRLQLEEENVKLAAENERLRAALGGVLKAGVYNDACECMSCEMARAALGGDK